MTALVQRYFGRPNSWNQSIANDYEIGKEVDTSQWTVQNFLSVNMYENWNYVCACEGVALRSCQNNPASKWKAQDWVDYLRENSPKTIQVNGEEKTITRGRKQKLSQEVSVDDMDEIRSKYLAGSSVATISFEMQIATSPIYSFLKVEGIMRPKGRPMGSTAPGKPRSTLELTPELIEEAILMVAEVGLVKTAVEMNLAAAELSVALKECGIVLQRGRKGFVAQI